MEYQIKYTGKFPNACSGDLIILLDGIEIFRTNPYSFSSNGSCYFDNQWDEHVTHGTLAFDNDEEKRLRDFCETQSNGIELFNECMEVINNYDGCCCGGCI